MGSRTQNRATFAEVIGSIKFSGKSSTAPARPWPAPGFAVNNTTHESQQRLDNNKLIRSSN